MKYLRSHCDTQVHKYDFVSEPLVQRMTLPSCFHLLESSPSSAVLNRSTPLTGGVLPWINPTIKTAQQYCSLCVKNILELALLTLFHTILDGVEHAKILNFCTPRIPTACIYKWPAGIVLNQESLNSPHGGGPAPRSQRPPLCAWEAILSQSDCSLICKGISYAGLEHISLTANRTIR